MGLSKKLIFGLVGSVAATTAIVGTSVGIATNTTSQNHSQNNSGIGDEKPIDTKPISTKPNDSLSTNQPSADDPAIRDNAETEEINVKTVAKKLTDASIFIKTGTKPDETKTISESMLYAFNVKDSQLTLDPKIKLPTNAQVKFEIANETNTTESLNKGNLSINVTIQNSKKPDDKGIKKLTLKGFKTSSKESEKFKEIFEEASGKLTLTIEPKKANSKYVSLTFLNENIQPASIAKPDPIEEERMLHAEEGSLQENQIYPSTAKESGLNSWIRMDEKKTAKLSEATVSGKVKLETISKSKEGDTTYFHLVSNNKNQKLKLSIGEEQIVFDEIKTTNLLAEEVVVYPIKSTQEDNAKFVEALKKTNEEDQGMIIKYIDKSNKLSIDLSMKKAGEKEHLPNLLFINPYSVTMLDETSMNLPIGIELKFGKDDYLTTFKTDHKDQMMILKNAGFNFGIYAKKINETDQNIKASVFIDEDKKLNQYFDSKNYSKPMNRPVQTPDKYPGGFALKEIKNNNLTENLVIELGGEMLHTTPENYLLFADYSYAGIQAMKQVLTPSISLIHLNLTKVTE